MRPTKWLLLSLILFTFSGYCHAQAWSGIIGSTRAANWQRESVGVPGGIPSSSWTQCGSTIAAYTGSSATINNALSSCNGTNKYVLLGAGTFHLSAGIMMNGLTGVELRGSGPTQTTLAYTGTVTCFGGGAHICMKNASGLGDSSAAVLPPCGGANSANCGDWTAGYSQGATSITLANVGASGINNGDVIILDQQNDTTDNGGFVICDQQTGFVCQDSTQGNHDIGRIIGGVAYSQQQQVVVVSGCSSPCSGAGPFTLTITPGLYANNWHGAGRPLGVWFVKPTRTLGVQGLTINNGGDATGGRWGGIVFYNCYGCWVTNVRSTNSNRNHIWIYNSARDEVRDSYFFGTLNAASQSYGVEEFPAHDTLIENNIFQQITGSPANGSGNVWGYNFSVDNVFNPSSWMQGTYISHDAGNEFSLWEGNQLNALIMDQLHGTSGLVTVFRNWLNGRDHNTYNGGTQPTVQTFPLDFDAYSRGMNVIGNVLGTPGYHTQYESYPPSTGVSGCSRSIYTLGWGGANCGTGGHNGVLDDTKVRSTLMRWGNYDVANGAVRWDATEASPSAVTYIAAQAVPASHTLPASFYLTGQPAWWRSMPYPAVGPEVTGGQGPGGFAYNNPAADCYFSVMGGPVDGSGSVLDFDADNCYAGGVDPPMGLKAVAR